MSRVHTISRAVPSGRACGPLRVVLADDAAIVRDAVARVLESRGIDVVGQVAEPVELLRAVTELRPDVAIVDLRMPPTRTVEGLEIAESILPDHPYLGVLILSGEVAPAYAERLLAARKTGVGYLPKERVADIHEFVGAVRRVAAGGTAFDPDLAVPRESVRCAPS
jgi:DNA-binding NarL/FixJ family response regulator